METNLAKAVVAQDSFKAIGEVVGFETFTHLIHADVVKVIFTVGATAQLTILCLCFTFLQQKNPDCWCEGERSQTRLCFCCVRHNFHMSPVKVARSHGVTDCDRVVLKVDRTPSETKKLTSAKTVECSQFDRDFKDVTLDTVKQFVDLNT